MSVIYGVESTSKEFNLVFIKCLLEWLVKSEEMIKNYLKGKLDVVEV